jgi:hypothetical protein
MIKSKKPRGFFDSPENPSIISPPAAKEIMKMIPKKWRKSISEVVWR